jgi:hypothetical protein
MAAVAATSMSGHSIGLVCASSKMRPFTTCQAHAPAAVATPEPSTWALMMLGFAGLGYAAFRKTRSATAIA